MKKILIFSILFTILSVLCFAQNSDKYLGNLSKNKYNTNSTNNPYGKYGSEYSPDSINNLYGIYGSKYSNKSVNNPYAVDTPQLFDSQGNYRGKASSNIYDPESISNPYGKYGSKYSPDSINNEFGAGSRYKNDSPNNPYGEGLLIIDTKKKSIKKSNDTNFWNIYNNNNTNSKSNNNEWQNYYLDIYKTEKLPSNTNKNNTWDSYLYKKNP